jgi:hypothetical protein
MQNIQEHRKHFTSKYVVFYSLAIGDHTAVGTHKAVRQVGFHV